eukprot:TRINITY_DN8851_c0_g1_i5.p1 TRINITY_DN8851_c0_g1~~TRINITY_DN8851_c0_g1_i5.p1  ORF type:complete len:346 (+),score=45.68 TRINITY_DN8851_c0_g1_i5:113-1150(+)
MTNSVPTVDICGHQLPIKYLSLLVLAFQNSALFLTLRASRTQDDAVYHPSAAVICSETCKLVASLFLILIEENGLEGMLKRLNDDIVRKPWVTLKLLVPAGLYTLQNNLLFLGGSYLDAATFQVTYQMKILTTALFSVVLLNKRLSGMQWLSLVFLMIGVALIQMPEGSSEESEANTATRLLGLVLVITACFSSGFAGVYFEKMLKGETAGVWVLNVQLATFSVIIATVGLLSSDMQGIVDNGFFHGFNNWAFAAIGLQAFGGLVVAVVVKYADNILKGFATSLSIVGSCIVSVYLFDFVITTRFGFGTLFVLAASYMYGAFAFKKKVTVLPSNTSGGSSSSTGK